MRVLITCRELALRAGSQLYTRDVALALRRAGHAPIVFAPLLGEVAAEVREGGVAVIERLEQLGEPPDLIHGQHHVPAMAAMLRFAATPAIFVCHGWIPWQEAPPRFPTIGRYVAVDTLRRDRLVDEHGVAPGDVEILENFVDTERFARRVIPLAPRPRKALLFSNQAGDNRLSAVVREVCAARGIELERIGIASGRPVRHPELLLPEFDLVFARGRSALEAMASGAAVILCDIEGDGPFVTPENFDRLRALNFGIGALQRPLEASRIGEEVDRFDAGGAARVCELVRSRCGLAPAVERLLQIYADVVARHRSPDPEEITIAASKYLEWLGPFVEREIAEMVGDAVRGATETAAKSDQQARDARAHLAAVEHDLVVTNESLRVLQRSPFSRARAALLRLNPVVRLYGAMRRKA